MWAIKEAERILKTNKKNKLIFCTGFGPSGMPHIGTFCEVFRTHCVAKALKSLDSTREVEIIVVSDDMDALRKIPASLKNVNGIEEKIGLPITSIPDPKEGYPSYGHYVNSCLCDFLDKFGFEYTFVSSTDYYKSGHYNEKLKLALAKHDKLIDIIKPTLGSERQKTYSPFLPICPRTGKILQVKIQELDLENNELKYIDEDTGDLIKVSALNGGCKLQWKPDWGMRWSALGVDYEMHGKDLLPSAQLSSKICRVLNGVVPVLYKYEMFLDQDGKKISKSIGNGLSVEDWVKYAPVQSLSLYMFQNPNRAKRLYFDCIPKSVDEYISLLESQSNVDDPRNPLFYINNISYNFSTSISFSLLLNLVSACNTNNKETILGFLEKYNTEINSFVEILVDFAIVYYNDFVAPNKIKRTMSQKEEKSLKDLAFELKNAHSNDPEILQNLVFTVGKRYYEDDIKQWFKSLYELLLGQSSGPRFGSFIALYGVNQTIEMIEKVCSK